MSEIAIKAQAVKDAEEAINKLDQIEKMLHEKRIGSFKVQIPGPVFHEIPLVTGPDDEATEYQKLLIKMLERKRRMTVGVRNRLIKELATATKAGA